MNPKPPAETVDRPKVVEDESGSHPDPGYSCAGTGRPGAIRPRDSAASGVLNGVQ